MTKTVAIACDLDGTLCQSDHRTCWVDGSKEKKNFEEFYKRMVDDPPHEWCVNLLKMYHINNYAIIFCTGRPEEYRRQTKEWIERHCGLLPEHYLLLMRETGNYESDTKLKTRLYQTHVEPAYTIEFVLEDRSSVVKMWRGLGLVCLQVAPGDF